MRRQSTKLLTVPVHVTDATAPAHGLPRWAVKTRPHRRPVVAGVHVHPSATRHIRVPAWADDREGIAVVIEPEVLRQISSELEEDELVEVIDAICGLWSGPKDGSVTPELVWDTVTGFPRFRGSRVLRRAIDRACVQVGSPQATRLRLMLIREGLPTPVVAHPIPTEAGVVHPDLAYPDLRIAIEYEGDHHRTDRNQWSHDIERERWVRQEGWDYIRVTAGMPDGLIVHVV